MGTSEREREREREREICVEHWSETITAFSVDVLMRGKELVSSLFFCLFINTQSTRTVISGWRESVCVCVRARARAIARVCVY